MVSTRLLFVLSTALLAFASPHKRQASKVESDITGSIAPQTTALANAVNGFPASGLLGALGIHNDATTLISTVKSATADADASSAFDEADGETIFSDLQSLVPTINSTLNALVAKKADFSASNLGISGVPQLVLQDLESLGGNVSAFGNALISRAPADQQSESTALLAGVAAAFAAAITAFNSSSS